MGDLQRGKDDNVLIRDLLQLNIEYRDIALRDATYIDEIPSTPPCPFWYLILGLHSF